MWAGGKDWASLKIETKLQWAVTVHIKCPDHIILNNNNHWNQMFKDSQKEKHATLIQMPWRSLKKD